MRFAIIRPTNAIPLAFEDHADLKAAAIAAGLSMGETDHCRLRDDGTETRMGIGMFVYEYGLMEPAAAYFSIDRQLFAGNAVAYAFGHDGDTMDLEGWTPTIPTYRTVDEVEKAIELGVVRRPQSSITALGVTTVTWAWNKETANG